MKMYLITIAVIGIGALGALWFFQSRQFPVPSGTPSPLSMRSGDTPRGGGAADSGAQNTPAGAAPAGTERSTREIFVTDGVKHSIPLDEILSGGPGKDGIPSIDDPKFISTREAARFLDDADPGIGLTVGGESRFYPYRILVWHEIANDTVGGQPVLVTYCPLCATGIVFSRRVGGAVEEFGVSGRLWQSNLLMYNRASNQNDESLWSQVLGEAVLGTNTGERLSVIRSDVVRFGQWKQAHPDTTVLSQDTGAVRDYGRDPYGNYYSSESVSFGATFNDTRLHPKALVHGVEVGGRFKAYHDDALSGTVTDAFAGKEITVTKTISGEITFTADGQPLSSIPGFWFSWLAVHPETELYK